MPAPETAQKRPDAHPSRSVGLPPTAEEYGDRGRYKGTWWQGGTPWGHRAGTSTENRTAGTADVWAFLEMVLD